MSRAAAIDRLRRGGAVVACATALLRRSPPHLLAQPLRRWAGGGSPRVQRVACVAIAAAHAQVVALGRDIGLAADRLGLLVLPAAEMRVHAYD